MTLENILSVANETKLHLESVEKKFFEVVNLPLSVNREGFKDIETFLPYKSNGGNALSDKARGKDFVPMQPKEFYNNIIATVHEHGADLDLNTLEFTEYCGGSKIEFKIKMFPLSFKNNKGLQDITNMWLTFTTSYDGSKSNVIGLYTERLVCTNGMVRSKLEGTLKGKNTINGKVKILSYSEEVSKIFNSANEFKKQLEDLDKVTPTKKQIEDFKFNLLGYNKESLKESDKKLAEEHAKAEAKAGGKVRAKNNDAKYKILADIEKSIEFEFERTGATAFGLLQGITYYTNHIANANATKYNSSEYIRFFTGAKTNDKAQDLVIEMLN
jgi:hypothetical protein